MRLLIDANAWDDVRAAIVDALGAVHPPVAHDVLEEWYKLLPPEVRESASGCLLASVIGVEGDLGGAWEDFERCAAAFREDGDITGELAALVQLGQIAWWSDRSDLLAQTAARTFELDAAGVEEATPFACIGRAMIYDITDQSREMLVELDRIPPGSLGEPWLGIVEWARAIALLQLGRPVESLAASERSLSYRGTMHAHWAGGTRLQAIWYLGRMDEVLDTMSGLFDRARQAGYRNSSVMIAAQGAMAHAYRGQPERAADYLERARSAAMVLPDAPLVDTTLSIAEATHAIATGDEARAAEILTAYVERHPIGEGLSVAAQRRHLALIYVLVPSTRPVWDETELGPEWVVGRDLARALVAVREQRRLPATAPPLDDVRRVQAHLPVSWVAQLAVGAIAAGRDDGWRLLEDAWPLTRPGVAAVEADGQGVQKRAAREVLRELPVPPDVPLSLHLLGTVELHRGDVAVRDADWRRERVRSLLAYLALHDTVSRGQVADDLWPGLDAEAQDRNLRVTLSYLLGVLEPDRARRAPSFFVRQEAGKLSLHTATDRLTVDIWDLDARCDEVLEADRRGAPAGALDAALKAVELWRGDPLELLSEPWAVAPVERCRRRFTATAVRAGELLLAQRHFGDAVRLAERALDIDPWLEAAHRLVVATHRAGGNNLAAHAALRRYRAASREAGLTSDEATLMVERLLESLP